MLRCPAVPFLPTQRLWNAPGELGRPPGLGRAGSSLAWPGLARIAVCRPRRRAPACFQDVLFTSLCSGSVCKACPGREGLPAGPSLSPDPGADGQMDGRTDAQPATKSCWTLRLLNQKNKGKFLLLVPRWRRGTPKTVWGPRRRGSARPGEARRLPCALQVCGRAGVCVRPSVRPSPGGPGRVRPGRRFGSVLVPVPAAAQSPAGQAGAGAATRARGPGRARGRAGPAGRAGRGRGRGRGRGPAAACRACRAGRRRRPSC